MEPDKATKLEDRRTEYTALRSEILQADNICLLMMGYLITAVGFLYSVSLEWLVSFLSFISLCYFTEKRFIIRRIASFIVNEVCKDDSGFGWEKYIQQPRQQRTLRPFVILRPYNAEVITCSIIAFSPAVRGGLVNLAQLSPSAVFWFLFAVLTLALSIVNSMKYNCA
jgi:hypothetical protein